MKHFLLLISIFFSINYAFNQEDLTKIEEEKYANHNSYSSFLHYLQQETEKLNSEIEKISFIRRQVAEIIDMGAGGKDIALYSDQWTELDGHLYYDLLYQNKVTIQCGGTSHFLEEVYTDLGYTCYTYDMGCPKVYTHQVTIVKNNEDGNFYVQDAFHNVSFYDKSKKKAHLSFAKMIDLLEKEQDKQILVQYDKYNTKSVWDTTGFYKRLALMNMTKYYKKSIKRIQKMNRKKFVQHSQKVLRIKENCLDKKQLPSNPLYLYLLPLKQNPKIINSFFD